jgi:aminopeptidase N
MGKGKKNKHNKQSVTHSPADDICPHSLSSLSDVQQTHLSLSLRVDFQRKRFVGSVEISFLTLVDDVASVLLDTRDLLITSVSVHGKFAVFRLLDEQPPFGRALKVYLGGKSKKRGDVFSVLIEYETSPEAMGLQWLDPELTEGKKHPYVFSQFQAIHARSFVPCQDTPGRKVTYDAAIRVPGSLTALMSALGAGKRLAPNGLTEFLFSQKVPISTYLIAIAVGNIHGRVIGKISTVWCEPERLDAAVHEFGEIDRFIDIADAVTDYPYLKIGWGRYDLLVLPGSFPYGGMENCTLTFVTPTLLAGDRSMVSTVIHELAHSWFGNFVTNHTWEGFWLNEGFTVWLERKIIGRLEGAASRDMAIIQHDKDFKGSLAAMAETPAALSLVQDMACVDPDDYFSSIPYEKGSQVRIFCSLSFLFFSFLLSFIVPCLA